jgi:hypothetical protein
MRRTQAQGMPGVVMVDDTPPPPVEIPSPFHRSGKTICFGDDMEFQGTFRDQNPIVFYGFSSLGAFADFVDALPIPTEYGTFDKGWSTSEVMAKFSGTASLEEALALARHGWSDGWGLAQKFDIPHALNKRRAYSLAGGSVNVGRMLAGNPTHMVRRVPQPKHRNITLYVETVMWRGISAANAMLRAILIISVIDLLEEQGYRCTVIAVSSDISWHDMGSQSQFAVRIKDAGERLNLLDISFALGHPSYLRRFNVCCIGSLPFVHCRHGKAGIVSEAFDETHPPERDAYYIKQLPPRTDPAEWLDPMNMLKHILPANLPLDIKGIT